MKLRHAKEKDLKEILHMLANDKLGKQREHLTESASSTQRQAFQRIDGDENQELIVMETEEDEIVGTLQLSFIQYLTYNGGLRAQIEAVRIKENHRGLGLGMKLFQWAIDRSKEKGAHLVQLTTDKRRPEALRFYEKLGFTPSHEGMKLHLPSKT